MKRQKIDEDNKKDKCVVIKFSYDSFHSYDHDCVIVLDDKDTKKFIENPDIFNDLTISISVGHGNDNEDCELTLEGYEFFPQEYFKSLYSLLSRSDLDAKIYDKLCVEDDEDQKELDEILNMDNRNEKRLKYLQFIGQKHGFTLEQLMQPSDDLMMDELYEKYSNFISLFVDRLFNSMMEYENNLQYIIYCEKNISQADKDQIFLDCLRCEMKSIKK